MFAFSMANFWSSMGMARGNAARTFLQTVEFLKSLESNHRGSSRFGFSFHAILHQQCRLILSERAVPRFRSSFVNDLTVPKCNS